MNSKMIYEVLLSLFPEGVVDAATGWNGELNAEELLPPRAPNTIEYDELLVFELARWFSSLDDETLRAKHAFSIGKRGLSDLDTALPKHECYFWARMSTWTIQEASLLSLGIIPSERMINRFEDTARKGWNYPLT